MKRLLAVTAALLILAGLTTTVSAATTWTARMGSYGVATLRIGTPDKLAINAKNFRARTVYTVTLRRGSCASTGTLVYSARLTTSSTGTLVRTVYLTSTQTRAAKLPLVIRIGVRCGAFGMPLVPGTISDGTWRVGTPIVPGTYRTTGTSFCYWTRLSGFGGTLDEIIANDIGIGPQVVTIFAADIGFKTLGCGIWQLQTEPPIAVPTVAPGDGIWRVGVDIQPGTYQTSGSATSCYWVRQSGFGGTLDEIIANEFTAPGAVIVTVAASDAGFKTQGCGIWTLSP